MPSADADLGIKENTTKNAINEDKIKVGSFFIVLFYDYSIRLSMLT